MEERNWDNRRDALSFRLMQMADIDQICGIEEEAFASPWTAAAFQNELANNLFARYVVMEWNGEIIGYGGMWLITDEAHITNIAVRSDYRGRKLGEKLLRELQDTARVMGASRMTLEVRVSNHVAQRLYKKMGFIPTGVRKGYYSDNMEDALIMWAELKI